jgi:DNA-directed RNA polymerase specialized sigma24 family protein
VDSQDEIVRLLIMQMRGTTFETQADAIRELGEAGFAPARIAELLGTSRGTVDVTLARAKRKKRGGSRRMTKGDTTGGPNG